MPSTLPAIAVLHYNKIRLTCACLDSLLFNNVSPERIYCLDNGSKPSVYRQLTESYPGMHHVRLESNRGFSGGFNSILSHVFSKGHRTCLFLTNDTIFHAEADRQLADILEVHSAGLAAPCIRYLSQPNSIDSLGAFFDARTVSLNHYHQIDLPPLLQPEKDYIPGTALAITSQAFKILNGTDERFHTYWEDVDLCFRAAGIGIRMARCPKARIDHGVGRTCHKKPFYTTWLFQRNRLLFCRRHLQGDDLHHAEMVIRSDWRKMHEKSLERVDSTRLAYMMKLFDLLNTQP
ncbi:MAG: glycosyltransferase family 2 protein [bacterium]